MAQLDLDISPLKVVGVAECVGGKHPEPPLDDYPLLAWSPNHDSFGVMVVHLEDQTASVEQVALALCKTPDVTAIAAKFGTTDEHVAQAVAYAVKAGFLGA